MKSIVLFIFSIAFFISCKNNNDTTGTLKINDEKTNQIRKCIEGIGKHDTAFAKELTDDSLKYFKGDLWTTKPESKKEWILSFSDTTVVKNFRLDTNLLKVETQYSNTGDVYTHVWTNWLATGVYSKKYYVIPIFIDFKWANNKISTISYYYNQAYIEIERHLLNDIYTGTAYGYQVPYGNKAPKYEDAPVKKTEKKK